MEERRIGMLYLANLKRRLVGLFGAEGRRSPAFPVVVLLIVLLIPAGLWFAHTNALFHKTKQKIKDDPQPEASMGPGGRDPVVMTRNLAGGTGPEFLSATVLPGLGMDILQITANVPGKGVVSLLAAPGIDELASGSYQRNGPNDLHGALEAPWGGLLSGLKTILGTSLMLDFQGTTFSIPTENKGVQGAAEGGLLQAQAMTPPTLSQGSGGVTLTGSLPETDFDGHWRSKTQMNIQIQMNAKAIEIAMTARNVGEEPEPMGLGWHPRFLTESDRAMTLLRLPRASMLDLADRTHELPTGRIVPPGNLVARFMDGAQPLRAASLDEALVHLQGSSPSAGFDNPAGGYGLRLTAVSTNLQELRVYAPADGNFVSLGFQTNFDNPLGHVWAADEPAIVILQPGQTLEYKVRLEIVVSNP